MSAGGTRSRIASSQPKRPENLSEARSFIGAVYSRVTMSEATSVGDCLGRCLADDVVAAVDLPRFDASAMDGYAIRSADLDRDGHASLQVVDEIAAGYPRLAGIGKGEAARIYTGAAIPPGVDRVVLQEYCRRVSNRVSVRVAPGTRPHIRLRGEDVLAGQRVLTAGTRLGRSGRVCPVLRCEVSINE